MKRLIARAADLGLVFLLLAVPTMLGNPAGERERDPQRAAPPVASYCDSLCSSEPALPADED